MSRNYVIINGVNSLTIKGLAINLMPPITKPLMRIMREEIDGRNGDINTELGYQAYDKQIEVGLFGNYDIDEIIAFFNSKGTIVFSDENDKFYNFQILDKIDFAKMVKFRTAVINIHCQPFKYPLTDTPVDVAYEYVESTGENLTLNNTEASSLGLDLKGNTSQATSVVPSEYKQLDFIESNGGQYIDINYIMTSQKEKIEAKFSYTNISSNSCPFGGRGSSSYQSITPYGSNSVGIYIGSSINLTRNDVVAYGINDVIIEANNGTLTTNWNGTTQTSSYSNTIGDGKIGVFAQIMNNGGINYSNMRCYRFKLYDNDVLKRDLIPCYRISDNVIGMYDLVDNNFYVNKGTGTFIKGSELPTPTNPIPVEVVTGDNEISITGKNIFDEDTILGDYLSGDYYAMSTPQIRGQILLNFKTIKGFVPNTQYTFSCVGYYSTGVYARIKFYYTDGTTSQSYFPTTESLYTITSTANKTIDYILLENAYNSNGSATFIKKGTIQLEANTTATTYEPYVEQSYEVNLPVENLLNVSDITLDGKGYVFNLSNLTIPNGTYTLNVDTTYSVLGVACLDKDGNEYFNENKSFPLVINATNGIKTLRVYNGNNAGGTFSNIQLELGSKANHFTPYGTTPIELCKIGNYQDTFKYENEKWYKVANIGKYTFTGNENWSDYPNSVANLYKGYSIEVKLGNTNNFSSDTLCDYLTALTQFAQGTTTIGYGITKNATYISVETTTANSTTSLKNWINDNKPTIYYLLGTPTDTEITDTTLKEQLSAIREQALSYSGQTNITQINDNKPFMIDATALKKGSDTAVLNNIGNIYSKPVIALQGTGIVNIYNDGIQSFQVDMSEENDIIIDTEMMEAYTPTKLANRQVTGDYSKFMIDTGSHNVKFDGELTEATITRYVRWL